MSDKCKCSFSIRLLGDGCRYCQPQEYIDRLHDSMEDMVHAEPLSDDELDDIFGICALNPTCTFDWEQMRAIGRDIEKHIKGE